MVLFHVLCLPTEPHLKIIVGRLQFQLVHVFPSLPSLLTNL